MGVRNPSIKSGNRWSKGATPEPSTTDKDTETRGRASAVAKKQ
jgi:hypothetical protein